MESFLFTWCSWQFRHSFGHVTSPPSSSGWDWAKPLLSLTEARKILLYCVPCLVDPYSSVSDGVRPGVATVLVPLHRLTLLRPQKPRDLGHIFGHILLPFFRLFMGFCFSFGSGSFAIVFCRSSLGVTDCVRPGVATFFILIVDDITVTSQVTRSFRWWSHILFTGTSPLHAQFSFDDCSVPLNFFKYITSDSSLRLSQQPYSRFFPPTEWCCLCDPLISVLVRYCHFPFLYTVTSRFSGSIIH